MNNDRIIRRIKGLLALAEGQTNVNESHQALLQAQQMMIKHGVDPSEITNDEEIRLKLVKKLITRKVRLIVMLLTFREISIV